MPSAEDAAKLGRGGEAHGSTDNTPSWPITGNWKTGAVITVITAVITGL